MTDPQPASPGYPPAAQPLSPADEKLWSTLAHVGNVLGLLPSLLIFLILGPRGPKVKQESREALNFVITAIIAIVALAIIGAIASGIGAAAPSGIGLLFGLITLLIGLVQFAVYVLVIVFSIVAAVRVNNGGSYRYPFALRLIK
ncbi:DUF4870 domain-containing protein [uncultured Amnibacterium sp.]|uniref:DUF4870 domain-containing protein n=1 Tax=uncultured Amnibacterium sp. TaxID=1631851 RepID=UPI0035C99D65